MKWILARMLEMDADSISVNTEIDYTQSPPETIYLVTYPEGQRRILFKDVLNYVEKHLKDDPLADRLRIAKS